jgi:hypothetical protein
MDNTDIDRDRDIHWLRIPTKTTRTPTPPNWGVLLFKSAMRAIVRQQCKCPHACECDVLYA